MICRRRSERLLPRVRVAKSALMSSRNWKQMIAVMWICSFFFFVAIFEFWFRGLKFKPQSDFSPALWTETCLLVLAAFSIWVFSRITKRFPESKASKKSVHWYSTGIFYTQNENKAKLYLTSGSEDSRSGRQPSQSVSNVSHQIHWKSFCTKLFYHVESVWFKLLLQQKRFCFHLFLFVCHHDFDKTTRRVQCVLRWLVSMSLDAILCRS